VLHDLPLNVLPDVDSPILELIVPLTGGLGHDDNDLSNVVATLRDQDGKVVKSPAEIHFATHGSLGCLQGGFCHVQDSLVARMSTSDVQNAAMGELKALQTKK
ncbi:unnamed protein product, partial [Durusdinium trenchii]